MDNLPEVLTRLTTRLDTLEKRVSQLEHPPDSFLPLSASASTLIEFNAPHAVESSFADAGATFAVFGKALLGMAGAYVLRAVAESSSLPKLAVVALAIAYAGTWLIWAMRVPVRAWFASTTYAATSALILAPMLWELALRFKVLTPSAAAGVLAAFVLAAYALAWKRNLTSIVWVAALTTALAAIALLIAAHDMVPFVSALLLMALLSEFAACRNRWLSVRPIVAIAADIAVWVLVYTYASPDRNQADYANIAPAALLAIPSILLLIYGTSVALRTTLQQQKITLFETLQAMVSFLLAADAVFQFGSPHAQLLFGTICLTLAAAGYAAIFGLHRIAEHRNYYVYATWSIALFLLGCFVCFPSQWLAPVLGFAAIVSTSYGVRTYCLTLNFHGLVYISAAAFASGSLQYSAHALAGPFPALPAGIVWIIAASTVLCYAIVSQTEDTQWKPQLFQTLFAALAVASIATALIAAMAGLAAHAIAPSALHVAVIRTLAACALALALAYLGPCWHRIELVWLAYGSIALVAAKLLLEDLRLGHPEFIAASIFLYAVTLILVPQIARKSNAKWSSATGS